MGRLRGKLAWGLHPRGVRGSPDRHNLRLGDLLVVALLDDRSLFCISAASGRE